CPSVLTDSLVKIAEIEMGPVVASFESGRPVKPSDDGLGLALKLGEEGPLEAIASRVLSLGRWERGLRLVFARKPPGAPPADLMPGTKRRGQSKRGIANTDGLLYSFAVAIKCKHPKEEQLVDLSDQSSSQVPIEHLN